MNWLWGLRIAQRSGESAFVDSACAESPYMEMIWACFMQMTNLVYATIYLEYCKFTNIRTRFRTNSCVY